MMKTYLVRRTDDHIGYDEYDSHIVVAKTEEDVIAILDDEFKLYCGIGGSGSWWGDGNKKATWVIEDVSEDDGLVVSSFNAG